MWPRNFRDFAWSTRISTTMRAIPRTTIHTMYFWIPPRPRGSLIRAVARKSARWLASFVEITVRVIRSTVPLRTPAGDATRSWRVVSPSGARGTRVRSTARTDVEFATRTAVHPEGSAAENRNVSSTSPTFATLNVNTASAPGSTERSARTGSTATPRPRAVDVSMMSSSHQPPAGCITAEVALNRTRTVDAAETKEERLREMPRHARSLPWNWTTRCHGPPFTETSTVALSVTDTVEFSAVW